MRKYAPVVLISMYLSAAVSFSAQQMNEPDSPCFNVGVTSDAVECLVKAKDASDSALNSMYQDIRKRLEGDDAKRLVETERLWVKYRDANCEAERVLYEPGTAAEPAYLGCLEAMTRARTKELRVTYRVRLK